MVYRYEAEYEEAKRKTKEALHPLKLELAEVDDQVYIVQCFTVLLDDFTKLVRFWTHDLLNYCFSDL